MLYGKWTVIKLKCLELQCTIAISKFPMHSKQKWQKKHKINSVGENIMLYISKLPAQIFVYVYYTISLLRNQFTMLFLKVKGKLKSHICESKMGILKSKFPTTIRIFKSACFIHFNICNG